MRTLKYAILGLLNQKEMTGYDLMKQFESTLCEFWSAKHKTVSYIGTDEDWLAVVNPWNLEEGLLILLQ